MIDSLEKSNEEVSVVIYDTPLPPKYFKLKKSFLKKLFFIFPILVILSFGLLFFWGLGSTSKKINLRNPVPKFENSDANQINQLKTEIAELTKSQSILTEKLSAPSGTVNSEEPFLMNIKKPYGMQNLIQDKLVSIDQFSVSQDAEKVYFKFQIISTNPETKIMGHVLVFMISGPFLNIYPFQELNQFKTGVKFSTGEPFSVSRLRPTTAFYPKKNVTNEATFIVYIFNREGDLLLIKESESFQIGANK